LVCRVFPLRPWRLRERCGPEGRGPSELASTRVIRVYDSYDHLLRALRAAPTGLHHPARGWSKATTLGTRIKININPERGALLRENPRTTAQSNALWVNARLADAPEVSKEGGQSAHHEVRLTVSCQRRTAIV